MTEAAAEPTVEATATVTTDDTPPELGDAGKKALDAMKAERNAAKRELQQVQKRLQALEEQGQSETERAIAAAKREADEAARKEVTTEFGRRIAAAEIKAALVGLVPDPTAIVEDLNLDRYITDDGDVDPAAVAALREKYAALAQPGRPRGDADQGPRGALSLNGDPLRASIENILNAR